MPEAKYYEWDNGLPAIWEPGKFPRIVGGWVVYDIEEFARYARPISKAAFDKLVQAAEKSRAT